MALLHMKPPAQAAVMPAVQEPEPLHLLAVVCMSPVHEAGRHWVPFAISSQTPPAAQLPSLPQGGAAVH
jgi:hypothetical protein